MKAIFKTAWPYRKDAMNLPVENLAAAIPSYKVFFVVAPDGLCYCLGERQS
jgi:hypothetical protein